MSRTATPDAPDRNLLVIAPPGCGKTELLALRAAALIPTLESGQRILALTFSNRAKANLKGRLIGVLGRDRVRRYVAVHNFHGHAAEIVQSHARTLRMPVDAPHPEKHTQHDAVTPYLEGLEENEAHGARAHIDGQLRDAKQGPFTDAQVIERLRNDRDERPLLVEQRRQESGGLYFDDLLRHAQRLLRVREVAALYQAHYGALLVDEFQDLSPQQLDIALRSSSPSRTFVGDPLQGIYSWTGARPIRVEKLLRRIAGEPATLETSYRSSPRVLTLLGSVAEKLGGRTLISKDPDAWFEGGIAAGVRFSTGIEEAKSVRDIATRIRERCPDATIGIICRSGWRRKPIDAEFESSGTPCNRWDLALDNAEVLEALRRSIGRLGRRATAAELTEDLESVLGPNDIDSRAEILDAVSQLAVIAGDTKRIADVVSQLRPAGDDDAVIPAGIHLLNAHTGKGQQFDWVIIPGLEKGNVPSFLARSPAELEEEQRVLLVMLSRARHGIVITSADSLISKKNKPYDTTPSPWAGDIRAGLNADLASLREHIARIPQA